MMLKCFDHNTNSWVMYDKISEFVFKYGATNEDMVDVDHDYRKNRNDDVFTLLHIQREPNLIMRLAVDESAYILNDDGKTIERI